MKRNEDATSKPFQALEGMDQLGLDLATLTRACSRLLSPPRQDGAQGCKSVPRSFYF